MELEQLLKECKRGSVTAQKYLYDRYAVSMFLLCRRYVRSDEAAEEVMMNGFLKCFDTLPQFQYVNEAATVGWIRKIMVSQCLMHLRHHSFLQVALDEATEIAIDEEVLAHLSAEEIFKLITQLPTGYRTVFNLYAIEKYSHKEISEQLGISEGTSRSQLSKAKAMLQQLLISSNSDYAFRRMGSK
ncbi:MAG: polymerase, sigma-24 subunit, subfamily [Flaviaesturariibacter sp.]|nr:polymerase, sigma-24 subunit, subfamily [Flaviaesturariibacter sp.]